MTQGGQFRMSVDMCWAGIRKPLHNSSRFPRWDEQRAGKRGVALGKLHANAAVASLC